MDIKELLVDGTTKKVYATSQSDQVIVSYSDVSGKSKGLGKEAQQAAETNNAVTGFLFEYLESYNVPTHYVRNLDDKSFIAKRVEMIPLVVTVYNVSSKKLAERLSIEEGKVLEYPIVEMFYKDDQQTLPMINEYHAYALGLCERKEMTSIMRIATKVNAVLKSFFDRKKLKLIYFNLEFGRLQNQILLADEVSLDSMELCLVNDQGKLEKVHPKKGYQELKNRIIGAAL